MAHTIIVTDENGTTKYVFENENRKSDCLRVLQGASSRIEFTPHKPETVIVKDRYGVRVAS